MDRRQRHQLARFCSHTNTILTDLLTCGKLIRSFVQAKFATMGTPWKFQTLPSLESKNQNSPWMIPMLLLPSSSILFVSLRFFGATKNKNHHQFEFHSSLRKDGGTYSTLHCGGYLCSDLGGAELEVFFKDIRSVWNGIRRNSPPKNNMTSHQLSPWEIKYQASNGICRSCK